MEGTKVVWPIQYLRGIAAMMVVWHHAPQQIVGMEQWFPTVLSTLGAFGVDIFFVISGFIMTMTTWNRSIAPKDFLIRRFLRVGPLYWLLTLTMVAVAFLSPTLFKTLQVSPDTLIMSLAFIPHFSESFPGLVWPLLVPGWTLNFEMFFYAVFALCLVLPSQRRATALGIVMLGLVVTGAIASRFDNAVLMTYTSPLLLEFALGALIGRWFAANKLHVQTRWAALILLFGVSLLLARDWLPYSPYLQFLGAGLIVTAVLNLKAFGRQFKTLRILGDASYSIYLTHVFTLGGLRVAWSWLFQGEPNFFMACLWVLLSMFASAVVGIACYLWVEKPLGKCSAKFFLRKGKEAIA